MIPMLPKEAVSALAKHDFHVIEKIYPLFQVIQFIPASPGEIQSKTGAMPQSP